MILTYLGTGTYRCTINGNQETFGQNESKFFPDNLVSEIEKMVDGSPDILQMSFGGAATIESIPGLLEAIQMLGARLTLLENPIVTDIAVLPESGEVTVPVGGSLILEIKPEGQDFFVLEVDHSLQGVLPEFSVYASEVNPYGDQEDRDQFGEAGVTVSYSVSEGKWTLDLGQAVTDVLRNQSNVRFNFVVKDANGNNIWGSMSPTTPENTRNYTIV